MSLALVVDAGRCDATRRFTAAIGSLLVAALLLSVLEQSPSGAASAQWWLSVACALACAAWCFFQCQRSACRPLHQLRLSDDGRLCLVAGDSGESQDAVLAGAWSLGPLISLRVCTTAKVDPTGTDANDPQSASGFKSCDCSFLLARSSFDEASWHGLRRWLVWHRRSRQRTAVAA